MKFKLGKTGGIHQVTDAEFKAAKAAKKTPITTGEQSPKAPDSLKSEIGNPK